MLDFALQLPLSRSTSDCLRHLAMVVHPRKPFHACRRVGAFDHLAQVQRLETSAPAVELEPGQRALYLAPFRFNLAASSHAFATVR